MTSQLLKIEVDKAFFSEQRLVTKKGLLSLSTFYWFFKYHEIANFKPSFTLN